MHLANITEYLLSSRYCEQNRLGSFLHEAYSLVRETDINQIVNYQIQGKNGVSVTFCP